MGFARWFANSAAAQTLLVSFSTTSRQDRLSMRGDSIGQTTNIISSISLPPSSLGPWETLSNTKEALQSGSVQVQFHAQFPSVIVHILGATREPNGEGKSPKPPLEGDLFVQVWFGVDLGTVEGFVRVWFRCLLSWQTNMGNTGQNSTRTPSCIYTWQILLISCSSLTCVFSK